MESSAQQLMVLVVEDDPAIRRLVGTILRRKGYVVEVANDGIEAVLKLGLADFDVIILDLMMPNLDGFAFLKTLGENEPAFLARVIVTSAASPTIIRERMTGQPFAILPKPFDIEQLARVVRDCIAARTAGPAASPPQDDGDALQEA